MNKEKIYKLIKETIELYIEAYLLSNVDQSKDEQLASLRSWSSLKNGVKAYINSSDLMPEFTLAEDAYASISVLGCEFNINASGIGEISVRVTDKGEYGLVDLEAFLGYVKTHMDDEKLDATLSEFFLENMVKVEPVVSVGSIKERTTLETKAEILDALLSRKSLSFDA